MKGICPDCQGHLSFVGSWEFRDLWGYSEVLTYECPTHGPVFVSPRLAVGHSPIKSANTGPDHGDRDALVSARRKPRPPLDADAIAIPEPDSN